MAKKLDGSQTSIWVNLNPKKLIIMALIILVPIFILSLAFAKFSRDANRFTFDKGDDAKYIYSNSISSNKKLMKYFDELDIKLVQTEDLKKDNKTYPQSKYTFKIVYKMKSEYLTSGNPTFEGILSTNWYKAQTDSYSLQTNNNHSGDSKTTMDFPFETPNRRLLVFKVGKPSLIVKITIPAPTIGGIQTSDDIILYAKHDLNKIKYQYTVK